MEHRPSLRRGILLPMLAAGFLCITPASAASLTLVQQSSIDVLGSWAVLAPGEEARTGKKERETLTLPAGTYTVIIDAPVGAATRLRISRENGTPETVERPQVRLELQENDTVTVEMFYTLVQYGTVGVQSDPPGMAFRLYDPNGKRLDGTTPFLLEEAPLGHYSVAFTPPPGCPDMRKQADILQKNGSINFFVSPACEAADRLRRSQASALGASVVSLSVGGEEVKFTDVPRDAWFAPSVALAARRGILSGYRDERGALTGAFGPDNPVTVAELAKIAHMLGSVDASRFNSAPQNARARHTWAASFFRSAEERGWTIYIDAAIDPARPATRGEVIVTLLQALDLPVHWQKGNIFADVSARHPFAAAIETAARIGLVDGSPGSPLPSFLPAAPVNRAELAKMIAVAIELYRPDSNE